jgi:uncharacterized protein YdhG (YjbR/CyaY superfamily)
VPGGYCARMADPVAEHLSRFPEPQRSALLRTRATIAAALPGADQVISYGMPTFKVGGVAVVGFEGFTAHNSLFPYSGSVIGLLSDEIPDQVTSKGTVHFPVDKPFPAPLLKRILTARIAEINASFPTRKGEVKQFYDNGRLKLSGRMKDDQMHGRWAWYRRDGSLMRTGSFRDGQRAGPWTTYDRAGEPVRTTTF